MLYLFYFLIFILLATVLFMCFYQIYRDFLEPGAVYYPSTNPSVVKMLELSQITKKDTLIDIGSGDGRILIAAARLGATAIGYEINPLLVWKSRRYVRQLKLDKKITIYCKSFWKADFNKATVVTVYLFPHLMNRLQQLLEKKVKKPLRVVVNDYPFPQLAATKHYKKIYLYNFD